MPKQYNEWKAFAENYEKVSVFFTAEDIFNNVPKYEDHRSMILQMFRDKGVDVYRFGHNYEASTPQEYWGLVLHRTDSDLLERTEVTALIGVNARWKIGTI